MSAPKNNERLADAIEALTEQVSVLRDSIDEFRTAIRWGIENDKFQGQPTTFDTEELVLAVQEQVHEEMSVIDESLNQFSIDMQWAVRQIREAADSVKTQKLLFETEAD